jgi:hypothetical protein
VNEQTVSFGEDCNCPECRALRAPWRGSTPRRERKYLPTLSDLVDRLTIVQMKRIFIHERKAEYVAEMALITHDIDLILSGLDRQLGAKEIKAIVVIMLANREIWLNESKAREGSSEQDKLLKFSHSINGVRNTAKNVLSEIDGGRLDYKVDTLSESLVPEFGNWNIF